MSNFRFILRKIFLIASGSIVIFLTFALYNTMNYDKSNLLDLGILTIILTAIGVNSLVVLYILEIEKKKLR